MHLDTQKDQGQQQEASSNAPASETAPAPGLAAGTLPACKPAAAAAASPWPQQAAASADTAADIDAPGTRASAQSGGEGSSRTPRQAVLQEQLQRRQLQQVAHKVSMPAADDPMETKMRQLLQQLKHLQDKSQPPQQHVDQPQQLGHQRGDAPLTQHLQEAPSGSLKGGSFSATNLQSLQQLLVASPGLGGGTPFRSPAAVRDQLIDKTSQHIFAQIQGHRRQQQHPQQQLPQMLLQQCHLLLHQLGARVDEDQQLITLLCTLLPEAKDLTSASPAVAAAGASSAAAVAKVQPSVPAAPDVWQQQLQLLMSSPKASAATIAAAAPVLPRRQQQLTAEEQRQAQLQQLHSAAQQQLSRQLRACLLQQSRPSASPAALETSAAVLGLESKASCGSSSGGALEMAAVEAATARLEGSIRSDARWSQLPPDFQAQLSARLRQIVQQEHKQLLQSKASASIPSPAGTAAGAGPAAAAAAAADDTRHQDQLAALQNELALAATLEPLPKQARAAKQQQQQQQQVRHLGIAAAVEQAALSMQPPSLRPQQQQQQQALLAGEPFATAAAAPFSALPAAAAAAGVEMQGSGLLLHVEGCSVTASWGLPPETSINATLQQQQQQPNALAFAGSAAPAADDEQLDLDPDAPDPLAHLVIPPKRKRGRPRKRPLEPSPPPPAAAAVGMEPTATSGVQGAAAAAGAGTGAGAGASGASESTKRAKGAAAAAAKPVVQEEELGALAALLQQHGYPSIKPS